MNKTLKAFTLVELMAAMAIIAIMLTLSLAGAAGAREVARDAERRVVAAKMGDLVKDYFKVQAAYPTESGGTFQWQASSVVIGGKAIALTSHLRYSATPPSNPGVTHYKYKRNLGGFAICVLLETGNWYAVGTLNCP